MVSKDAPDVSIFLFAFSLFCLGILPLVPGGRGGKARAYAADSPHRTRDFDRRERLLSQVTQAEESSSSAMSSLRSPQGN